MLQKLNELKVPNSVEYYHQLISKTAKQFVAKPQSVENTLIFLSKCAPYLMSIRNKIGISHDYCINLCTIIAKKILHILSMENIFNIGDNGIGNIYTEKTIIFVRTEETPKETNHKIWLSLILLHQLKGLSIDIDFFNNTLIPKYNLYLDIVIEQKTYGDNGSEVISNLNKHNLDQRDEDAYFNDINSINDCYHYQITFPNSKHSSEVTNKVEEFEFNECQTLEQIKIFQNRYPQSKLDIATKLDDFSFASCKTIDDYKQYIITFSKHKEQAFNIIEEMQFKECNNRESLINFISDHPFGKYKTKALAMLDDIDYTNCQSLKDFEQYLIKYPYGTHVKEAKLIIAEEKLWNQCIKKNSSRFYKRYIKLYPNGKYIEQAREKSITTWDKLFLLITNNKKTTTYTLITLFLAITSLLWGDWRLMLFVLICSTVAISTYWYTEHVYTNKHSKSHKTSIGISLFVFGIIGLIFALKLLNDFNNIRLENNEYINFINAPSEEKLIKYLDKWEQGKHKKEIYLAYINLLKDSGPISIADFANNYTDINSYVNVRFIISQACDSLYEIAKKTNTRKGWQEYCRKVPAKEFRDAKEQIRIIEEREWNDETTAWNYATSLNNIFAYNKYLKYHPKGYHAAEASKKVIDIEVDNFMSEEHEILPPAEKKKNTYGTTSSIQIHNDTEYELTIYYSGSDSKKIILQPQKKTTIKLKNGQYRCVASVDANVRKYGGTDNFDGGEYSITFYISKGYAPNINLNYKSPIIKYIN